MFDGIGGSSGNTEWAASNQPSGAGTAQSPLKLRGALDADGVRLLRDRFVALAETAAHDVVVDFTNVGFLDGAGVGAIAFLVRRLAARRMTLRIAGAAGQPLQMLRDLGLAEILANGRTMRPGPRARILPSWVGLRV